MRLVSTMQSLHGAILLAGVLALSATTYAESAEKVRVCYYPSWSLYRNGIGKFNVEHVDPFLCTHVVFSFPRLDNRTFEMGLWDPDQDDAQIKGLVALKLTNPDLKIMIAIGGWNYGTKPFQTMTASTDLRKKFVDNVIAFMESYKLDGMDLDWEYPAPEDKERFSILLSELRAGFGNQYLLSIALGVGADKLRNNYDLENIHQYLDWFGLMAYDLAGAWDRKTGYHTALYRWGSSDTLNLDWVVNEFLNRGIPPNKIVLGLATYGRAFTHTLGDADPPLGTTAYAGKGGQYTQIDGILAYYEICLLVKQGALTEMYDDVAHETYAYGGSQFVSYDNKHAIVIKAEYALEKQLGGLMVWDISMDDFHGQCGIGRNPLLATMKAVLTGDNPDSPSFTPYPNPFEPTVAPGCDFTCPENGASYYSDPCSCRHFIDCRTALTIRKVCPGDLYWNNDKVYCDHQYNVKCSSSVEKPLTPPPAPEEAFGGAQPPEEGVHRVCYYTNWAQYRSGFAYYSPKQVDPFLCTHIIYSFLDLAENFTVKLHESNGASQIEELVNLKTKNSDLKIMIAVGGQTIPTARFSEMARTADNRRVFTNSVMDMLETYSLDGFDLDWQFPMAHDRENLNEVMREFRTAFGPAKLLSIAIRVFLNDLDNSYDLTTLSQYVDWFGLMTYDLVGYLNRVTGHHSPLYPPKTGDPFNQKWVVNELLITKAIPSRKLMLGVATYGRSFTHRAPFATNPPLGTLADKGKPGKYTKEEGYLAYYEICLMVNDGELNEKFDSTASATYAYGNDQFVSYDNKKTIIAKARFSLEKKLGGMMVWDLSTDDVHGHCGHGKNPLLTAMKAVLIGDDPNAPSFDPYPIPFIPTPPPCVFECPEDYGIFPSICDCDKYYTCGEGKAFKQTCKYGQHFNAATKQCDFPEVAKCGEAFASLPLAPAPGEVDYGVERQVGDCEFTCPSVNGMYRDGCLCERYYECYEGIANEMWCPEGHVFDDFRKMCDFPESVDCNVLEPVIPSMEFNKLTAPPTTTTTPVPVKSTTAKACPKPTCPEPNGYFSHPCDCGMFLQCVSGRPYEKNCASGLLFNPASEVCDFEVNVKCDIAKVFNDANDAEAFSGASEACPTGWLPYLLFLNLLYIIVLN